MQNEPSYRMHEMNECIVYELVNDIVLITPYSSLGMAIMLLCWVCRWLGYRYINGHVVINCIYSKLPIRDFGSAILLISSKLNNLIDFS